ncbi:hypothetical protein D3C75_1044600 [compost metagenome]
MLEPKALGNCEIDRNYSKGGFLEDMSEHFRLFMPIILSGRVEQNDTHALARIFHLLEANSLQQLLVFFYGFLGQAYVLFQRLLKREGHCGRQRTA